MSLAARIIAWFASLATTGLLSGHGDLELSLVAAALATGAGVWMQIGAEKGVKL